MDVYDFARGVPSSEVRWSEETVITPEPWTQDALCAQIDPEMFFPHKADHARARSAKQVCGSCPVVAECLAFALRTNQKHGIWGGKTAHERSRMQPSQPHRNAGKDTCVNGHPFTPENTTHTTYVGRDGVRKPRRKCRTCDRDSHRRGEQRKRDAA